MDYTEIPRSLIYKERNDLKDFGVHVPETMNHLLFLNLKELFKATDRKKELILRCFNNAYYICTIIPFEDFPETQVAEYEKLLFKGNPYDCEEICAVSMAMVCKLLPASDARWKPENNDLIETIRYRFTHYQWMNRGARKSFEFMEGKHNTDGLIISPSEFAPRDILELIENHIEKPLQTYADYICERLALLKDPSQRVYGTDLAIARIKDYQRVLCEECEYNPKKDSFKHTVNYDPIRDLSWEKSVRDNYQKSKEAIDYYTEHYPTKEEDDSKEKAAESSQLPETEDFQATIMELNSNQAKPSNSETVQLQARIKELQEALAQQKEQLSESEKTIKQLQEQIADYAAKYDPKDIKGKKVAVMTGKQHVILYLAILAHHDRIPNARTNLSWELSFISARRESTMHDYLKKRITQEECDALAEYFKETPFIADLIKALPPKLKEDLSEKNRNKALKNNKE